MPPGPVQSAFSPVMGSGKVCAAASRMALGEAMPSSAVPVPSSVPPTKSRRVISGPFDMQLLPLRSFHDTIGLTVRDEATALALRHALGNRDRRFEVLQGLIAIV